MAETEDEKYFYMRVIIDSRSNIPYSSFYILGLIQKYGKRNVCFRSKPFRNLPDPDRNLRFIIVDGNSIRKFFIHTNDSYHLNIEMYDWCDVYGCVNANYSFYPKSKYPKLVSLVPSFGINCFNLLESTCLASANFLRTPTLISKRFTYSTAEKTEVCNVKKNIKRHFASYIKNHYNRCSYTEYDNVENSSDDYIFFLSTLWYSDEWNNNDESVNKTRANFIRACKSIKDLIFEGGMVSQGGTSSNDLFSDCLSKGVPMREWMSKTKKSSVVFNTPAFWNCHGWKLGEYLAMGKCIISTELSNDLPAPLVHGENIHFVENTEEAMKEAIEYIIEHPNYRHKLEKGAYQYWHKYGTPEKSLELLGI